MFTISRRSPGLRSGHLATLDEWLIDVYLVDESFHLHKMKRLQWIHKMKLRHQGSLIPHPSSLRPTRRRRPLSRSTPETSINPTVQVCSTQDANADAAGQWSREHGARWNRRPAWNTVKKRLRSSHLNDCGAAHSLTCTSPSRFRAIQPEQFRIEMFVVVPVRAVMSQEGSNNSVGTGHQLAMARQFRCDS